MNDFHQVKSAFGFIGMKHIWAAFVSAAVLLAIAPLHAQQQVMQHSMTPEQSELQKAYQETHADYMAAQQRLKKIQRDTLQAHPELQKQEQSFNDLLMEEMKNEGHTPKLDLAEIEKLQERLQGSEVPDSERQTLMGDFQGKMIAYRKAQAKAMQTQKMQKAQGDLMESMVTAMKAQDPKTEQLIQQMTQKRQELERMMESATQAQGQ
jgi:hypothetical protein